MPVDDEGGFGATVAGSKTVVVKSETAGVGFGIVAGRSVVVVPEAGVVVVVVVAGPLAEMIGSTMAAVTPAAATTGAVGEVEETETPDVLALTFAEGRVCSWLVSDPKEREELDEGGTEALASLLAVPRRIARTWLAPRLCVIAKAAARAASAVCGSVPVLLTGVKYIAGCPPTIGPAAVCSGTTPPVYIVGSTTMRCVTQPSGNCVREVIAKPLCSGMFSKGPRLHRCWFGSHSPVQRQKYNFLLDGRPTG